MNALRQARVTVMVVTRSATDAARRVTLLVTARKAVASATVVVVVASLVVKPATLAVVSATWLATAHRARSATTVSLLNPLLHSDHSN